MTCWNDFSFLLSVRGSQRTCGTGAEETGEPRSSFTEQYGGLPALLPRLVCPSLSHCLMAPLCSSLNTSFSCCGAFVHIAVSVWNLSLLLLDSLWSPVESHDFCDTSSPSEACLFLSTLRLPKVRHGLLLSVYMARLPKSLPLLLEWNLPLLLPVL